MLSRHSRVLASQTGVTADWVPTKNLDSLGAAETDDSGQMGMWPSKHSYQRIAEALAQLALLANAPFCGCFSHITRSIPRTQGSPNHEIDRRADYHQEQHDEDPDRLGIAVREVAPGQVKESGDGQNYGGNHKESKKSDNRASLPLFLADSLQIRAIATVNASAGLHVLEEALLAYPPASRDANDFPTLQAGAGPILHGRLARHIIAQHE